MSEIDEEPITRIPKHAHVTTFDNLPIIDECDEESSDEELPRKFDKRLLVSNPSCPSKPEAVPKDFIEIPDEYEGSHTKVVQMTPAEYRAHMKYTEVKDSGERTEFETGAARDLQEGKGRYDLISPIALSRLAQHYENGAKKYEDRNWEKGIPLSRFMDSMIRHAFQFLAGDRSEDHMAAVAWNAFGLIHTETRIASGHLPMSLGDLPHGKWIKDE